MLSPTLLTAALVLSAQAQDRAAPGDIAVNGLLSRPNMDEVVPANSRLYVMGSFLDPGGVNAEVFVGDDDGQVLNLRRRCAVDERSCVYDEALPGLSEGDVVDIVLSSPTTADLSFSVSVGPEDNEPPDGLELEPPTVAVFVEEATGEVLSFEMVLFLPASLPDDVALMEVVAINDDQTQTALGYRLGPTNYAFSIPLEQTEGELCVALNSYDLAGNKTMSPAEPFCRTLDRQSADEEHEVRSDDNVNPLAIGGCNHTGAGPTGLPAGWALLLGGGLFAFRRRRD